MAGAYYIIDRAPTMTLWERLYLPEIVRGLGITIRHLVRNIWHMDRRMTIEYPDQRLTFPQGYRAEHRLMLRPDDTVRCTSCMLCATACPARCIEIVAEDVGDNNYINQPHGGVEGGTRQALPGGGATRAPGIEKRPRIFTINELRCVFCGLCVEACPCDAIRMDTGKFENAAYSRQEFMYDIRKLMTNHPEGASPYSTALY